MFNCKILNADEIEAFRKYKYPKVTPKELENLNRLKTMEILSMISENHDLSKQKKVQVWDFSQILSNF